MLLVKKYPNRRLYDTRHSRYITLEDLERLVRDGSDVVVEDAQTGRDLTQEVLTQIILERGGGRILPTALLMRLIRLDDEALGEFLTRYVSWALEVYMQAKQRARTLLPLNPLATAPFAATDALARLVLGASQWASPGASAPVGQEPPEAPLPPPPAAPATAAQEERASAPQVADVADEMARLRREIEALKQSMGAAPARAPRAPSAGRAAGKPAKKRARAAKR